MEDKPRNVSNPARKRQYGRIFLDALAEVILRVTTFGFGFLWWSLKWSVAVLIFLIVMAGAGYYVFNEAVANDAAVIAGKQYVEVPDIQGKHISNAEAILRDSGLSMGTPGEMMSDKVPENYVIFQRPAPGTVVRAGRRVFPTKSKGTQYVRVPNLVGKNEAVARDLLGTVQLAVGQSVSRIVSTTARDTVIGQFPPADREVESRSTVSLLVSDGPNQGPRVIVPDLKGMSINNAKVKVTQLGLNLNVVKDTTPGAALNIVLSQRPEYGKEISPGEAIAVNVRTEADVPDMQRRASIVYEVPQGFGDRQVEIIIVGKDGSKVWAFPDQSRGQAAPKVQPGSRVRVDVRYSDELTVEAYLDGALVRRYYYLGDNPPRITDY